ncbi:MAG: type phosphodiesterase/nucleotide pyrophosphatase [Phenylobacterium sp.]|uniref:alkaline phosphatase family protein n=1 Tax=Phenylobacterium sp. TaxID=1871053 RepID=UPI00261802F2|nr:alkaline phosphatase family protein [Phenylobacterium sp.]MDB5497045.1 type phosphodiesterase/nucleotide pyrophosphatase [Phenylobacterium sp.]
MTRLLVIGAAGLDWPNLSARAAPQLARLQARGTAGWLRSAGSAAGPAPWVSMVTGHPPERHGIWRREEAYPGGIRPISRASWREAPVWERLAAVGVTTASVAWPGARPGAAWRGEHIDRDFAEASGPTQADWALPLRCAPLDLREALRGLRVHPSQITGGMLRPLAPTLNDLDQSRDVKLPQLAVAMAQAATVQAAAVWLLAERRPDVLFVHHAWLGEVLTAFESTRDGPFAGVTDGAWRFFDGLVGRLAELAGEEALVMVVSPGWGGRPGTVLAAGPAVAAGGSCSGSDVSQVAATTLAAFGLVDGALPPPIPGIVPDGPRAAAFRIDMPPPAADLELLRDATKEGYAAPPPAPGTWRAEGFAELAFMLLARDADGAIAAADQALACAPDAVAALAAKAMALIALEEAELLPDLARKLARLAPRRGWGALARAAYHALQDDPAEAARWLAKAEPDLDPEVQTRVAAVWFAIGRPAEAERVFRTLLERHPDHAPAAVGLGMAAAARRDFRAAEEALLKALKIDPGRPAAYLQLAQVYAQTARRAEARQAADRAVSLGAAPDQAEASLQGRLG